MKLLRSLVSYFTLEKIECRFVDLVTSKEVWLYRDKYGKTYLKDGRWALFKMEILEKKDTK